MKHLKPKQHYIDLYDKLTVQECRWHENYSKEKEYTEDNPYPKDSHPQMMEFLFDFSIYWIKGERYAKKEGTIREWMNRDEAKDDKLENAVPSRGINCLSCGTRMNEQDRMLHTHQYNRDKEEVLFTFICPKCEKLRGFWESGEEWVLRTEKCPKCHKELNENRTREGNKVITISTCKSCGYEDKDVFDLDKKCSEPIDHDYEKDRARFCLFDEKGQEYINAKHQLESLGKLSAEIDEREKNKDVYDKIAKLKKLTIAQVQKLLTETIDQHNYSDLQFSKPEFSRHVIVEFTCMEQYTDRDQYKSERTLKKLIQTALEDTTWRLMKTDGISYRMGYLSGRIKAFENEDDLKKLIK